MCHHRLKEGSTPFESTGSRRGLGVGFLFGRGGGGGFFKVLGVRHIRRPGTGVPSRTTGETLDLDLDLWGPLPSSSLRPSVLGGTSLTSVR